MYARIQGPSSVLFTTGPSSRHSGTLMIGTCAPVCCFCGMHNPTPESAKAVDSVICDGPYRIRCRLEFYTRDGNHKAGPLLYKMQRACRVFTSRGGGGSIEPRKTGGVREKGSIDRHH